MIRTRIKERLTKTSLAQEDFAYIIDVPRKTNGKIEKEVTSFPFFWDRIFPSF